MVSTAPLQPAYRQGKQGALHFTCFLPESLASTSWIVHVPAFAEEMNKSRAIVAKQARELADLGHGVLVPDLFGTGDSEGQFEQIDWDLWVEDLVELCESLTLSGATQLTLWGLRIGCLLAADVATKLTTPPKQLLFWQPVHSGKQQLTQLLRIRLAASMAGGSSPAESMGDLRNQLEAGESVEVAGYSLPGKFYQRVNRLNLRDFTLPSASSVRVIEVSNSANVALTPLTQQQVQLWQENGSEAEGIAVQGDTFWMTQELAEVPALSGPTITWFPSVPGETECQGAPLQSVFADSEYRSGHEHMMPVTFECEGHTLAGIVHTARGASAMKTGVVIVVGGPQYRVGSHRQFQSLASSLARGGFSVLRFDVRGMGDSEGEHPGFLGLEADIRCAIDKLIHQTEVERIVVWGLCDAATAAVSYAGKDERVTGLVLANPWVYSPQGAAQAYLRYYYIQRLFSRELWRKVFSGKLDLIGSVRSIVEFFAKSRSKVDVTSGSPASLGEEVSRASEAVELSPSVSSAVTDLVELTANSLQRFSGKVLIMLSGRDLVAAEFKTARKSDPVLRRELARRTVKTLDFPDFDHTFSRSSAQAEVERVTLEYLRDLEQGSE